MCSKLLTTLIKYYLGNTELHGSSLYLAIVDECLRTRLLAGTRKNRSLRSIFALLVFICALQFTSDLFPEDAPYFLLNTALLGDNWSGSAKLYNMCTIVWCIECLITFWLNFSHYDHYLKQFWIYPFVAISGASEYAHLAAQFTDEQIIKMKKLLKILPHMNISIAFFLLF